MCNVPDAMHEPGREAIVQCCLCAIRININLLTPNVNYSGRTASLTSKVAFYIFSQQI